MGRPSWQKQITGDGPLKVTLPGHNFVFYFPAHFEPPGLRALTITDRADAFAFPTMIYRNCEQK